MRAVKVIGPRASLGTVTRKRATSAAPGGIRRAYTRALLAHAFRLLISFPWASICSER